MSEDYDREDSHDSEESTDETLQLTEWLENQKERAEDQIEDESVGEEATLRWEGERQLIKAIQAYLDAGMLEVE